MYDSIIIGAGPAGITAGIYIKRAGFNPLVLYSGGSNLQKAHKIDNYYGFENGISGEDLYEAGINQAKNLEIEVNNEEVLAIEKNNEGFVVSTLNNKYSSKTIIIATGNKKLRPNIKGVVEFEGAGISYCAICDGFFYRNKDVVVIGNGNFANHEADDLNNFVNSITILTNCEEMLENTEYSVDKRVIKEIKGDTKVRSIVFEDGEEKPVDGIFIALGEAGGTDFAKKLGVVLEGDNIQVDSETMQTNIEGLYSCGDVVGGLLQVCKSGYDGAKAGLSVVNYLRNNS